MIKFEWIFLSFMIGMLTNYILAIKYLKGLRGERNPTSDWSLISCSIVWGTPILLFMYCIFPEIRIEDSAHKKRLLISQLIILTVQIVLLVVLSITGIISYDFSTTTPSEIGLIRF